MMQPKLKGVTLLKCIVYAGLKKEQVGFTQ